MNRKIQIVVVGSSEATSEEKDAAYEVGKIIASLDAVLISGGRGGVMESASRGAFDEGGLVVGILPDDSLDAANPYCHIVIPSGMGFARNLPNVLSGDAVVVIGGSSGTLCEIAYAWQYNCPIYALSWINGCSYEYAGRQIDDKHQGVVHDVSSLDKLKKLLEGLMEV